MFSPYQSHWVVVTLAYHWLPTFLVCPSVVSLVLIISGFWLFHSQSCNPWIVSISGPLIRHSFNVSFFNLVHLRDDQISGWHLLSICDSAWSEYTYFWLTSEDKTIAYVSFRRITESIEYYGIMYSWFSLMFYMNDYSSDAFYNASDCWYLEMKIHPTYWCRAIPSGRRN